MARPNKRQHKIPRTYLEAFTNNQGVVWAADQNFKLYPQKPTNILRENDYYIIRFRTGGGTLDIETKFLGGIEITFANIYREKIQQQEPISNEDKAKLSIFIASMIERQPMARESLEKFFADGKEIIENLRNLSDKDKQKMAESSMPHDRKGISADEFLEMGKDVGSLHSSLIPNIVVEIAPIIFNMKWIFMISPEISYPFITSDNPCKMKNPVAETKFGKNTIGAAPGLGQENVEITLPLSSNLALMCRWHAAKDCIYGQVDETMVGEINKRTIRCARLLIGSNKEMLKQLIEKAKRNHQDDRKNEK